MTGEWQMLSPRFLPFLADAKAGIRSLTSPCTYFLREDLLELDQQSHLAEQSLTKDAGKERCCQEPHRTSPLAELQPCPGTLCGTSGAWSASQWQERAGSHASLSSPLPPRPACLPHSAARPQTCRTFYVMNRLDCSGKWVWQRPSPLQVNEELPGQVNSDASSFVDLARQPFPLFLVKKKCHLS